MIYTGFSAKITKICKKNSYWISFTKNNLLCEQLSSLSSDKILCLLFGLNTRDIIKRRHKHVIEISNGVYEMDLLKNIL